VTDRSRVSFFFTFRCITLYRKRLMMRESSVANLPDFLVRQSDGLAVVSFLIRKFGFHAA